MFFFPFRTDAPIYYWPVTTVVLVALNCTVFWALVTGHLESPEQWLLWYGHGLHPAQWLRSIFLHCSFDHLLGNMLFLWVFGLVVEGKLGWWKFLACYLAIGVGQSMVEQTVMLGYDGGVPGSLGASAAIFGLMAMAVVWAPKNNISFGYLIFFRAGMFDVPILGLAPFYVGMEILFLALSGGDAGSSWLHLSGFALGLPLAVVLLKHKVVDCEGWDLFHVWRGNYGAFQEDSELPPPITSRQPDAAPPPQLADPRPQLHSYLRAGNTAAAVKLCRKVKDLGGDLRLDRSELLGIVRGLHTAGQWAASAPFMAELIDRYPDAADPVRVKLAQICVVELERPGKALDLLAAVNAARLPEKQTVLAKRVAAKARQMQNEGTVEIDTDAW